MESPGKYKKNDARACLQVEFSACDRLFDHIATEQRIVPSLVYALGSI
jgi:hypothetical protein